MPPNHPNHPQNPFIKFIFPIDTYINVNRKFENLKNMDS